MIDPAANVISGLEVFNGQTVKCVILRDDPATGVRSYTIHPDLSIVAGVSSELSAWALQEGNTAILGYFYENEFKLLPREGVSNRGTSQVSKMRWNKIVLRVSDSSLPLVEGEYSPDRNPLTAMGTGEPIVTADVEYSTLFG